jgi:hydrogenase/urease accessory protein HupE
VAASHPFGSPERGIGALLRDVLLALFLAFAATPAAAHPVPFSYLDVEVHDQAIEGRLRVHLSDLAPVVGLADPNALLDAHVFEAHRPAIETYLASRISLDGNRFRSAAWGQPAIVDRNEALELPFRIEGAPPAALTIDTNLFPGDPDHQTFVNVYEGDELRQQFIFARDGQPSTYYRGTAAGVLAVIQTFVPAGIEHILIGYDHLLFLFGLLLLGGGWRRIALIITAFTIGHSITLSLAALNILALPGHLVEPAIALSIVVVGVDNLLQRKAKGRDLRPWVAGVFGLIHGFGFASVLREFGLPQEALGWSLFSFNVGVELGQLAAAAVVISLLAILRRKSPATTRRVEIIGSVVVIAGGAYWFVERVFLGG